jgi:SAM-dependent methyltransferase
MKNDIFNAYSNYYDVLYQDKNYKGETAYINERLSQHDILKGKILEFGSGTGIHARQLVAKGHEVDGIELSLEMMNKAEIIKGFSIIQGDIGKIYMGVKYDAVLSLFHVISYQVSNAQIEAVFANAAAHLNNNGIFLFDFWYSPAVYAQNPSVRIKRMSDGKVEIIRIAEPDILPNENRVNVNYTIIVRNLITDNVQIMKETHQMRHFSLPEIDILAAKNSFKRVSAEEFLSGNIPSEKTWGVCVILKKI